MASCDGSMNLHAWKCFSFGGEPLWVVWNLDLFLIRIEPGDFASPFFSRKKEKVFLLFLHVNSSLNSVTMCCIHAVVVHLERRISGDHILTCCLDYLQVQDVPGHD